MPGYLRIMLVSVASESRVHSKQRGQLSEPDLALAVFGGSLCSDMISQRPTLLMTEVTGAGRSQTKRQRAKFKDGDKNKTCMTALKDLTKLSVEL